MPNAQSSNQALTCHPRGTPSIKEDEDGLRLAPRDSRSGMRQGGVWRCLSHTSRPSRHDTHAGYGTSTQETRAPPPPPYRTRLCPFQKLQNNETRYFNPKKQGHRSHPRTVHASVPSKTFKIMKPKNVSKHRTAQRPPGIPSHSTSFCPKIDQKKYPRGSLRLRWPLP